jgi:hypothetical protein
MSNRRNIVWVICLLCCITGCDKPHVVRQIGEGFGRQMHGGNMPHAHKYVSLMRTNMNGKWITIWNAISYSFQGEEAIWNKATVFGGVTSDQQAEQRTFRLLYFSEATGVVDVTQSVAEKCQIERNINPGAILVKRKDFLLTLDFISTEVGPFTVQISFDDLAKMAKTVRANNRRRVFDGNEFYE